MPRATFPLCRNGPESMDTAGFSRFLFHVLLTRSHAIATMALYVVLVDGATSNFAQILQVVLWALSCVPISTSL